VKLKATIFVITAGLAVFPAFGQEEGPQKQEVSVLGFGSFLTGTTNNGVHYDADETGGVLASYRYFFNQHNGVEVNYAFSDYSSRYDLGSTTTSLENRSNEVSATYVFRFRPVKRITPFAEAGVGGVIFDPKSFLGSSTQARAAFVYGAGADVNLSRHLFLRAEYRGLVYDSPTWGVASLAGYDRTTHQAEPALGIGWRF
jgi:opacity protein-like surface antigen